MSIKFWSAVVALLGFAALSAPAHAVPDITLFPYTAQQVGTSSSMSVGLIVRGHTMWYVLTVGGGFTVACANSSLTVTAENAAADSSIFGDVTIVVPVPPVVPATYPIIGWSSLAQGQCQQCAFQYRGRAVEALAQIAVRGGVGFTLNVGGDITQADTQVFTVCRPALVWSGPRGCYP
jgi:hypothetical protein